MSKLKSIISTCYILMLSCHALTGINVHLFGIILELDNNKRVMELQRNEPFDFY